MQSPSAATYFNCIWSAQHMWKSLSMCLKKDRQKMSTPENDVRVFSAWNMKFALIRRQKMQYSLPWYPLRVFCYGIMFSSRQLCFLNWKQDSCSHHSPHLLQLGNSVQFSYYLVSVKVWINVGGEGTEACLELLASAAFVPTCLEA